MKKHCLSLIGVGAFGELAARHLAPHLDLVLYDPHKNLKSLAGETGAHAGTFADAAACEIVVLSVPVQAMRGTLRELAPLLSSRAVVMDVASVKVKPARMMQEILPAKAQIVGTHPLFGPQSGKDGIAGLNMVVCPIRGRKAVGMAAQFCRDMLDLNVLVKTPEEHDRDMAFVQAVPHLIARVMKELALPPIDGTTKTYNALLEMVRLVGGDSDQLFHAIMEENPYAQEAVRRYFDAAQKLENGLRHLTAK